MSTLALEPFKTQAVSQHPKVLPHLNEAERFTFDINLEVQIRATQHEEATTVARSNYKHLYWSMAQQLTHHASNGCNIQPGDLYASGTISGNEKDSFGSMMELSWNGEHPIQLSNDEQRAFLEDGDEVIMTGYCQGDGYKIGFGECSGTLLPPE